jgi:hypothetical protein
MSFVPKDITTLSTVLSSTLDLEEETARKEYGDYFHEIIEGRNTRDNSSLDDETERKDTSGQADSNPTTDDNNSVNVLLGASNCKRD